VADGVTPVELKTDANEAADGRNVWVVTEQSMDTRAGHGVTFQTRGHWVH